VTLVEVLPEKFVVAAYTALITCDPAVSVEVLNVAVPVALSVPVPRVVPPCLNDTLPVGIAPVDDVSVAVKVTN
jgi:hypothetical protein